MPEYWVGHSVVKSGKMWHRGAVDKDRVATKTPHQVSIKKNARGTSVSCSH